MSLTHFEPRQDEGNTLNPGSTPAPLRDFKILYTYTMNSRSAKKNINPAWGKPKEKNWSYLEKKIKLCEGSSCTWSF
jgi:hypothetical protein